RPRRRRGGALAAPARVAGGDRLPESARLIPLCAIRGPGARLVRWNIAEPGVSRQPPGASRPAPGYPPAGRRCLRGPAHPQARPQPGRRPAEPARQRLDRRWTGARGGPIRAAEDHPTAAEGRGVAAEAGGIDEVRCRWSRSAVSAWLAWPDV